MEDLLDLIFSNIGFIFIILGGIYSFMKRQAAQEKKNQPIPRKVHQPSIEEVKRYEVPKKSTTIVKTVEVPKTYPTIEKVEIKVPQEDLSKRINRIRQEPVQKDLKEQPKLIPNAPDQIIQGVIWSEILGPPKAKVPHMGRKTNRI